MADLKESGSAGSRGRMKGLVNKLREKRSENLGERLEKKEGKAIRAGMDYDKITLESGGSKKDRKKVDKAYKKMDKAYARKEKIEDKKAKVDKKIAKYEESLPENKTQK